MDERVKIEEGGITVPAGAPAAAEAAPGGTAPAAAEAAPSAAAPEGNAQSGSMPGTGGALSGGAAAGEAAPGEAAPAAGEAASSAAAPETQIPKGRGVRGKVIGCLEEMAAIGLAVLGACMFYNTRGTRLLYVDVAFGRICRFYWIALAGALVFFAVGIYTIKRSRKEVKKHGKLE